MNDDPDFLKWIEIFDTALTSDNPLVKEQLNKLLMIAALTNTTPTDRNKGPLAGLYTEIKSLRAGLAQTNNDLQVIYQKLSNVEVVYRDGGLRSIDQYEYMKSQHEYAIAQGYNKGL